MAANPGKEKARFPFTHKHGLITKSAQAVKLARYCRVYKKGTEKSFFSPLCISVNFYERFQNVYLISQSRNSTEK